MKRIISIVGLFLILNTLNAKNFRIDVQTLSANIDKYVIIDTRRNDIYLLGHIPGAINIPAFMTFNNLKEDGKIVTPKKFQKIARNLGLHKNDNIVIYDDGSFFDASRLFWTLEVYGFDDVKLLDSPYSNWIKNKYKTTTEVKINEKSNYISSINNTRLATKFATQIATKNPSQIIIDARGSNGYNGIESSAKRFGHIPKAINIPATHNIMQKDGMAKLHDVNTLKSLYANIDKNKKVIIYCSIGKISSTNYFAMRELGFNVSNYDASWKEWGNEDSLPIVNPLDN